MKSFFELLKNAISKGDVFTKVSLVIMGVSNIARGQVARGLLYFFFELCFFAYMITTGLPNLANMRHLGTHLQDMVYDEAQNIFVVTQGDNSMLILLFGVVTIFVLAFFLIMWGISVADAYRTQQIKESGKKPAKIIEDIKSLFDSNIHKLLLLLPVAGLIAFTVIPLVYMILMAFTNYDSLHQPPGNLFTWVGIENFRVMLGTGETIAYTFWPILGWTMIWAVFATFTNYFFGMFLAMLINSKGIHAKSLWRTIFVLTIAIPLFSSLLGIRLMLAEQGAFNVLLLNAGLISAPLPFLTDPNWARVTVVIVNMWVGIPHTMLITTGILMNIPAELYESAKIDGASPVKTYTKITLPYILFITTPYLLTQFINNINNFSVIYFLTRGNPLSLDYFKGAGKTDLLVTWLYKLTKDSKDYSYASTIGIMIFVISAVFSLIVFRRSGAYKNEEGFQ